MNIGYNWPILIDTLVKDVFRHDEFFSRLGKGTPSTPMKNRNGVQKRKRERPTDSPGLENKSYSRFCADQFDTINYNRPFNETVSTTSSNQLSTYSPDKQSRRHRNAVAGKNGNLYRTNVNNEQFVNKDDKIDGGGNDWLATTGISPILAVAPWSHSVDRRRTVRNRSRSKSPSSNGRNLLGSQEEKFTFFFTKKYPFSNHYPCNVEIDGRLYNCTEQYYMYKKAEQFNDSEAMENILNCDDPKKMKVIGNSIKGFKQNEWNRESEKVMFIANFEKYKQNKKLRFELFATEGTTLVETNPSDQRWGIGLSMNDERALNKSTWRGQNLLGRILTSIRDNFIKDSAYAEELATVRRKRHKKYSW